MANDGSRGAARSPVSDGEPYLGDGAITQWCFTIGSRGRLDLGKSTHTT